MIQARFIQEIGTRGYLRVYWGDNCVNCGGSKARGYHNTQKLLSISPKKEDWDAWGKVKDYKPEQFGSMCDHCPALVPQNTLKYGFDEVPAVRYNDVPHYQIFHTRNYSSASGDPEEGDLYLTTWYGCRERGRCIYGWENCDGQHLFAIVPGGDIWDIHSRASNCTMPQDNKHRCWVLHGTPPNVTVDKNGLTCAAGAGSIQTRNWHGFLQNGRFTP
jgi:hypothetical protein